MEPWNGTLDAFRKKIKDSKIEIIYKTDFDETGDGIIYGYWNGIKIIKSECKNKKCNGVYEYYHENGKLAREGIYKDDYGNGLFIDYYETGIKHRECIHKNGLPYGNFIEYFNDGTKWEEGQYIDGKREGLWICWSDDKKTSENEFKNGLEHGKTILYNGDVDYKFKKYEVDNVNGEQTGKWIRYYDNGQKMEELDKKNGLCHGREVRWFENGLVSFECEYKNGKKDGKCTSWYDNGNKKEEIDYKDNKIHGEYICYCMYPRGQIFSIISYKNDKLDGESKYFWDISETFQIYYTEMYKNGKKDGITKNDSYVGKHYAYYIEDKEIININLHLKGWKVLTKLIENKKNRRIKRKMLSIKDVIYRIQGDNIIYMVIMDYLDWDTDKKIILEEVHKKM